MSKVQTLKRSSVDCPCGCGQPCLLINGQTSEQGPIFRSYLLRESGVAHVWTMLIIGPWPDYTTDCGVIVHSLCSEKGVSSSIQNKSDSPWKDEAEIEGLEILPSDVVTQFEPGKEWVFETWALLMDHQPDIYKHVRVTKI